MKRWNLIWQFVTKPATGVHKQYDRERATAYSAMLFFGTIALIIYSIVNLITPVVSTELISIILASTCMFICLYIISRTRFYRWSIRLYIWTSSILLFFAFFTIALDQTIFLLNFLAIPIILSGFLLNRFEALFHLIFIVISVTVAQILNTEVTANFDSTPLLLLVIGGLSFIIASSNRYYNQQAVNNELRYRSLMEANYEGILIIDPQTARIKEVNPAITAMTGYTEQEMLGTFPADYLIEDDKEIARDAWFKRMVNIGFDFQLKCKDGTTINVEARLRQYQFQGQEAYVLTIWNITDRKQAENLILESEERFRAVFNGSVDYIAVLDADGAIIELNDSAYEMFGYAPNTVHGNYLWDFDNWAHSEKSKAHIKAVIRSAQQGQSSRYETQARDKDGATLHIDFSLRPIHDIHDNVSMIIVECRDITAYRLTDAEKRAYEMRYQTLFNNMTDGVFIYTLDGQFIEVNQRAIEMLQTSKEELSTKKVADFVAPHDRDASRNLLQGLAQGNTSSRATERQMQRANGDIFFAETMGVIVEDSITGERHVLSMVRDINERKRLEQERFTAALESERTQLLAHFIENASHHFRTPITNMKTRLYLLPRVIEKPEKREEQIDILNQELDRLQNILDDLLAVLRLQKDDTELSLGKFAVNLLLSEVRQTFEGRSLYQDFTWQWLYSDDESQIFGDRVVLGRAISNIIENATTYTPADGTITVRAFTRQNILAIDIIDTGSGITDDELPYIFEDFYRGQDAQEKDSTSSGLGLTIAKMSVDKHQGRIFVDHAETGGAHFQIVLPLYYGLSAPMNDVPTEMLRMSDTNENA